MSPAERELVINRLRLVAYNYYSGKTHNPVTQATLHRNGICYAAHMGTGNPGEGARSWYILLGDAFELLGMDRADPFAGEGHGDSGDWTVRPLFCLLMADALEQM
jgi:hypothetical protein